VSAGDASKYREQAEYCRLQAKKAVQASDKAAWLKVSDDWLKLAEDAERDHSKE